MTCSKSTQPCPNVQIPLGGFDQTLSETRVGDKVRWVRAGLRQVRGLCLVGSGRVRVRVVEFGTGPARLCRWSGLVGSLLNPTTRTRPDMSAPATRSPTKSGPCQTPLRAPTDSVCDPTRPDQTHGRSPYMSTTRQSRRTCRRPKRSVGLVRSVQWNLDVTRRVRRLQRN